MLAFHDATSSEILIFSCMPDILNRLFVYHWFTLSDAALCKIFHISSTMVDVCDAQVRTVRTCLTGNGCHLINCV